MNKYIGLIIMVLITACSTKKEKNERLELQVDSKHHVSDYLLKIDKRDLPFELPDNFDLVINGASMAFQIESNGDLLILANQLVQGKNSLEMKPLDDKKDHSPKAQAFIKPQVGLYDASNPKAKDHPFKVVYNYEVPDDLASVNSWIQYEGPVWESEKIAFRYYADSRNLIDVFGKRVNALVLDTAENNYHEVSSWGADVLKVGTSLGMGSPAILNEDGNYHPLSNLEGKTISIENVPLKSTVLTKIPGTKVGNEEMTAEMNLTIYAGQRWSEVEVKADAAELNIATGIVKHEGTDFEFGSEDGWHYGWSWGKQSDQGHYLGMAILIEDKFNPKYHEDDKLNYLFHLKGIEGAVRYRILAAWELEPDYSGTKEDFQVLVMEEIQKWNNSIAIQ